MLKAQVFRAHHSTSKWVERLNIPIDWPAVWRSVHNPLARESTRSTIWEQLHLNNYTTASYNRWHQVDTPCPLCQVTSITQFHLILDCPFTLQMWTELTPFLTKIHPSPPTPEEMAFGVLGNTPAITLRNWFTYLLRECIFTIENAAHHNGRAMGNAVDLRHTYNARVLREVNENYHSFLKRGRTDIFIRRYTPNDAFLRIIGDTIDITHVPNPLPV